MNRKLAIHVIEELIRAGVEEFILCPGARNAPLIYLISHSHLKHTFCYEERSGAFYALGVARKIEKPVAIVTTSGTAASELLPAAMEAYYTSVPLVLVTADRPRIYRGCNAPQSAFQVGLYGIYAPHTIDLEQDETFSLEKWPQRSPFHLNVCFDDPASDEKPHKFNVNSTYKRFDLPCGDFIKLEKFFKEVKSPLIIVNKLSQKDKESVIQFLENVKAPVYLEGVSGIRNENRLGDFQVIHPKLSNHDGVLRIGGVPTHRIWRDLEDARDIQVLSISEFPFSGLSYGSLIHTDISLFFNQFQIPENNWQISADFKQEQKRIYNELQKAIAEEPMAEQSLVHQLTHLFPEGSLIYLGNSLPIRHWDMVAVEKSFNVQASRGLNGIDGQISCFYGLCKKDQKNFALIGDLTALYDFAAGWVLPQVPYALFVINNKGGRIFNRRFNSIIFQNAHALNFKHFAKFWNMPYQEWNEIPENPMLEGFIEICPDPLATARFWKKWDNILAVEAIVCQR